MSTTASSLYDLFPTGFKLADRLARRLIAEFHLPEGYVRATWVARLILEYGFDQEQLDLNVPAGAGRNADRSVVFADIVAYRDKRRDQPFLVAETKAPGETKGLKQAQSYARNLGADYHLWTNGVVTRFFRTARFGSDSPEIGNIPHWLGDKPVEQRLAKTHELPPFRDENHLRNVVKQCHDRIFVRLGHDPAKAFDELMKVLFVKLYDERETPGFYEFMVLAGETKDQTAARISDLFQRSIQSRRYKDVFGLTDDGPPSIDLDADTITYIVQQFQGFSLVNTSATLQGADVKGTVFEQMVGGTFRGELGAYFTPREIVEFMVRLISPTRADVVLDLACGSGGFLIMALKYVLEDMRRSNPNLTDADIYSELRAFAENSVLGTDLNARMVRVAKMNMIMHGDGHGGIFRSHGLDVGYKPTPQVRPGVDVTCVFSNPPFTGRETDPAHLEKFVSTRNASGNIISTPKSIPFGEHILNLLKPDGKAALVLPNGIFSSNSHQFKTIREIIWAKSEILAIIDLPYWVFLHTGCDVQGALLFLNRTDSPRDDYNVFIDWAQNVGYDAAGRKTSKNDLPSILGKYRHPTKRNLFAASYLRSRGRIDPLYYQPGEHHKATTVAGRAKLLTDLLVECTETIKRKRHNKAKVQYLEVGDTDKQTGRILRTTEYEIGKLPSRAHYIVRENMLLIPNHRNSIKSGRSVVLVPPEYDGLVVTSRFIAVRSKVPAPYLFEILNLDFVKAKMLTLVTGSSSTEIKYESLAEISIPLPEGDDFDLFLERIEEERRAIDDARLLLAQRQQALDLLVRGLYQQAQQGQA